MSKVIRIDNFDSASLQIYKLSNENSLKRIYEPNLGLFIAESPKVIIRALEAGYEAESLLLEDRLLNGEFLEVQRLLTDVPVYVADEKVLSQITGYRLTRGVLCAMKRRQIPSPDEICAGARRVAVLENIENPTNLGAIFRSAAALGIDAVLLSRGCTDPLYRRAIRVSMGTVFQVPWTFYGRSENDWLDTGIDFLQNLGLKTAAMALSDKSIGLGDKRLLNEEKLAIIMGTEGEGLSERTIERSDYVVKIPMTHGVDSLNVAAASAVAFWQLAAR